VVPSEQEVPSTQKTNESAELLNAPHSEDQGPEHRFKRHRLSLRRAGRRSWRGRKGAKKATFRAVSLENIENFGNDQLSNFLAGDEGEKTKLTSYARAYACAQTKFYARAYALAQEAELLMMPHRDHTSKDLRGVLRRARRQARAAIGLSRRMPKAGGAELMPVFARLRQELQRRNGVAMRIFGQAYSFAYTTARNGTCEKDNENKAVPSELSEMENASTSLQEEVQSFDLSSHANIYASAYASAFAAAYNSIHASFEADVHVNALDATEGSQHGPSVTNQSNATESSHHGPSATNQPHATESSHRRPSATDQSNTTERSYLRPSAHSGDGGTADNVTGIAGSAHVHHDGVHPNSGESAPRANKSPPSNAMMNESVSNASVNASDVIHNPSAQGTTLPTSTASDANSKATHPEGVADKVRTAFQSTLDWMARLR